MKGVAEAVKYGIETLNVTPDEMFSLIESSNGYSGEDYKRWLANEIIKIAESRDVGFSQLLVKKFAIIQSLAEEVDATMKDEWKEYLLFLIGTEEDTVFSDDFEYFGKELENIDWFNGIDYDSVNTYFTDNLPEELKEKLLNKEDLTIVSRLSSDSCSKGCELFSSAKSFGVTCKNKGSLMLYRMCSLVDSLELEGNFKFAFFTSVDFLTDPENADIFKHLVKYFNCNGVVVKSTDLYSDMYISTDYAFVVCTPRGIENSENIAQDGILLDTKILKEDEFVTICRKRYTRSSTPMLEKLLENMPKCSDMVFAEEGSKLMYKQEEFVKGRKDAYGYLNLDSMQNCWLSSHPDMKSVKYIPITESNLKYIVVYYAVTKSLSSFGLSNTVYDIVTGNREFEKLFYNCFPLFLFDTDSKFCDYGLIKVNGETIRVDSKFDVNSDLVNSILEKGEVYFSFEAKELVSVCKGLINYLKDEEKQSVVGMTFEQIRKEANYPELNESYINALLNIKDYIKIQYRSIE